MLSDEQQRAGKADANEISSVSLINFEIFYRKV